MIVTELMGGMGNQMFQYALGRHLSIKYNTDLVLDKDFLLDRTPKQDFVFRDYDLDIFNVREKFASDRVSKTYGINKASKRKNIIDKIITPPKLKYIKEERFEFDSLLFNIGDDVYLNGYWQSEKYFREVEHIIREDFTFKTGISEKANELGTKISNSNAVCINVRRGDFVNHPVLGSVDTEYYTSAFRYIEKEIISPVIYIFSDEIDWCKEHLKFDCESHYVSHEYAGKKFRDYFELMIKCKYFIIPNSTFAWWAAWLCTYPEKIVVAPKVWFKNSNWNYQDVVPENWIKI